MRLFVALLLSEEMKTSITAKMHELKKSNVRGSYAPTQNLHVTLAFLGEIKDDPTVKEILQTVRFKPFRLSLADMGTFGDTLWVGIKGNQGLNNLARDVRAALDSAGIEYDKKKFSPHITMIRKMTGNWKTCEAPKGEMMVKKLSLMKSEMKDGKRSYTEIFSVQ